jgi:hypothetical protein
MKPQYTTVFVIREVSTGKLIKFGPKAGWATSGAAKNAFNLHMWGYFKLDRLTDRKGLYDKQNEFIIEEIE